MKRAFGILLGLFIGSAVFFLFVAAAVLDRVPAVPPAPLPQARDVRAAVELAGAMEALVISPAPVPVHMPMRWFEGAHRLVGHAKDNLAAEVTLDGRSAVLRLSKRLAAHAWLNLALRFEERGDGPPHVALRIGRWAVPDRLTALAIRIALRLLLDDGPDAKPPGFDDLVPRFAVTPDAIDMTARVPKELIGAAQALLGSGGRAKIDMTKARSIYGDLLAQVLLQPRMSYAGAVAQAMRDVSDRDGARAAIVALTMLIDGPRVRRFAGERTATPPCLPEPQPLLLQGRSDLPKHWTISAALALFLDERPARAIGLWKELDDSLPGGDGVAGGTGFSFVDLTADTGGVALGKAARDGDNIPAVVALLRLGRDDIILPRQALGLPDGVPLARYEAHYGGVEQPVMLEAERRIRALLRTSPLYGLILESTP